MPLIDPADYKAAKEAFVSNLNGTSLYEITLVTLPLPLALWAYTELRALRLIYSKPTPGLLLAFCYEFTLLILPQVLAQCLPEATPWVLLVLFIIAVVCRTIVQASREPALKSQWRHDRAGTFICTSMCIYFIQILLLFLTIKLSSNHSGLHSPLTLPICY